MGRCDYCGFSARANFEVRKHMRHSHKEKFEQDEEERQRRERERLIVVREEDNGNESNKG